MITRYKYIWPVVLAGLVLATDAGAAMSNARIRNFNEEQMTYWQSVQASQKEMLAEMKADRVDQKKNQQLLEKQIEQQQHIILLLKELVEAEKVKREEKMQQNNVPESGSAPAGQPVER